MTMGRDGTNLRYSTDPPTGWEERSAAAGSLSRLNIRATAARLMVNIALNFGSPPLDGAS